MEDDTNDAVSNAVNNVTNNVNSVPLDNENRTLTLRNFFCFSFSPSPN
jgi:hypothetical protein